MKNSKLRRVLMLLACAVLLVSLSVGATLAYLTSTTPIVQNTFTVGKVHIDLDEADVNQYGELEYKVDENGDAVLDDEGNKVLADRVLKNEYKLLPGHTYVKDPIVYVQAGSEPCLVYVLVDDPLNPILTYQTIGQQMSGDNKEGDWEIIGTIGTKTLYYYKKVVDARAATAPVELDTFKYIKVDPKVANATLETYAGKTITVQAFAIQADGMITDDDPLKWLELSSIWDQNFAETAGFDLIADEPTE